MGEFLHQRKLNNKKVKTELEKVKREKGETFKDKEIYQILINPNRKSLNITFLKGTEKFTVKVDTRDSSGFIRGEISSSSIANSSDRDEFIKFFNRSNRTTFEDIQEIKYSGKTLYKKQ